MISLIALAVAKVTVANVITAFTVGAALGKAAKSSNK